MTFEAWWYDMEASVDIAKSADDDPLVWSKAELRDFARAAYVEGARQEVRRISEKIASAMTQ